MLWAKKSRYLSAHSGLTPPPHFHAKQTCANITFYLMCYTWSGSFNVIPWAWKPHFKLSLQNSWSKGHLQIISQELPPSCAALVAVVEQTHTSIAARVIFIGHCPAVVYVPRLWRNDTHSFSHLASGSDGTSICQLWCRLKTLTCTQTNE